MKILVKLHLQTRESRQRKTLTGLKTNRESGTEKIKNKAQKLARTSLKFAQMQPFDFGWNQELWMLFLPLPLREVAQCYPLEIEPWRVKINKLRDYQIIRVNGSKLELYREISSDKAFSQKEYQLNLLHRQSNQLHSYHPHPRSLHLLVQRGRLLQQIPSKWISRFKSPKLQSVMTQKHYLKQTNERRTF